jgi:hypothetical protein
MMSKRACLVRWHTIPRVAVAVDFASLCALTLADVLSFSQATEASVLLVAAAAAVHFNIDWAGPKTTASVVKRAEN